MPEDRSNPARADYEDMLKATDHRAIARRTRQLDDILSAPELPTIEPETGYRLVRDGLRRARDGYPKLSDKDVLDLIFALQVDEVRDACYGLAAMPADDTDAVVRLWVTLTRESPKPERAIPAILLAFTCYLRKEDTLAKVAVATAQEADYGDDRIALVARAVLTRRQPEALARIGTRELAQKYLL